MSYLFPFHATDIMMPDLIAIEREKDVKEAIIQMRKCNITGLPVVSKKRLVGISTKPYILSTLAN